MSTAQQRADAIFARRRAEASKSPAEVEADAMFQAAWDALGMTPDLDRRVTDDELDRVSWGEELWHRSHEATETRRRA